MATTKKISKAPAKETALKPRSKLKGKQEKVVQQLKNTLNNSVEAILAKAPRGYCFYAPALGRS